MAEIECYYCHNKGGNISTHCSQRWSDNKVKQIREESSREQQQQQQQLKNQNRLNSVNLLMEAGMLESKERVEMQVLLLISLLTCLQCDGNLNGPQYAIYSWH